MVVGGEEEEEEEDLGVGFGETLLGGGNEEEEEEEAEERREGKSSRAKLEEEERIWVPRSFWQISPASTAEIHSSFRAPLSAFYCGDSAFYSGDSQQHPSTVLWQTLLHHQNLAAGHSNNMFSRVASRVMLHSAKNRAFISPAPSKFRALFSGTPNQQASGDYFGREKPLSPEVIDELRNIFLQVSREDYKGYYLDELICNNTTEDPGDDHVSGANCCLSPLFFRLMRDVAFEVATFHQNGVIHGNINPRSIFILKGKRLFAKLVDDDTSKWKAPEQLLNGSQTTKASDMFNLGCVLFTCITKGGQPFGGTLDQHHENVMENEKSLSRVKSYPEAFNLLSRLLNREPELRPIAMEVLSHPIFWHSEKRLAFLQCCSKQIEYEIKQSNSEILEDLDSIAPIVMDEKWDEEIRSVRLSCSFEEVQSLLQFIRETFSHYDLMPARLAGYVEELQPFGDSLKPHYRVLDEYLARRYPWLLIYLHNLMLKHFGNSCWFSVYCLREFNQVPHSTRVYHDLGEGDGLGYGDGDESDF